MKILSRPKGNAEEYGRWAVNAYLGCPNQCHYCVGPDTLVLMADGTSKRIDDIEVDDEIYGIEKSDTGYNTITKAKVTAKAETFRRAWRLTFSNGQQIVCSGDHRFLTDRGWKYAAGAMTGRYRRPYLTKNNDMVCIPEYPTDNFAVTDDYRRGYLSGISLGDANMGEYHYDYGSQHHYRLALKEREAIDRTREYMAHFGIEMNEFEFPMKDRATKKIVAHTAIRKQGVFNYEKIKQLIAYDSDSREWLRGFMAGIYDAEGDKGPAKRMSNSDERIINTYIKALKTFGFDYVFDVPSQKGSGKTVHSVRLKGGMLASLRFVVTCRPAITSLFDFTGHRLKFSNGVVRLTEKKKLPNETRLIDIETTTGNFFANGIVAHNCYLKGGPGAKNLGGSEARLKAHIVNAEHAYHIAMTEIIENREQIRRDGGLFFTFTSDPCLPETCELTFRIAADAMALEIPVTLLTKDANFCGKDRPQVQSMVTALQIDKWLTNIVMDFENTHKERLAIGFTLTGHDELEPNASPNAERIKAIEYLSGEGWMTWASIEPVIDFPSAYEMVRQALDAGCRHLKIGLMTKNTKVCRKGFSFGGHDFAPYDPAECLAFVQDVMTMTRDRATVYWKQSFREFLRPVGSKRPKAERIGGTPAHRLFKDDEPMEQREQNGACSSYAESRQRSAESQLHKIFDDYPNAVDAKWNMFNDK